MAAGRLARPAGGRSNARPRLVSSMIFLIFLGSGAYLTPRKQAYESYLPTSYTVSRPSRSRLYKYVSCLRGCGLEMSVGDLRCQMRLCLLKYLTIC